MRRGNGRILTTHGGNLPRPKDLDELIAQGDREAIDARLPGAVEEVVARQVECGIDTVNDGEYVKAANLAGYSGYIHSRVTGWETLPIDPDVPPKREYVAARDKADFPGTYASGLWLAGAGGPIRPGFSTPGNAPKPPTSTRVCTCPITYIGQDAIARDVAAMKTAVEGKEVDGFIAALGPLSLGAGATNAHYASEEEYMFAVAEALREEYRAVTDAGLVCRSTSPSSRPPGSSTRPGRSRTCVATSSSRSRSSTTARRAARRADPDAHLLGQRPPAAHAGHRPRTHRGPADQGQHPGLRRRVGQRPARARVAGVGGREAARGQDSGSRRGQSRH